MIDIKNKIITAILIVIVTMSMLASAGSEDVCDETGKVRIITMDINPVKSPTNISTQIISGSGFASGCGHCGIKYPLQVTVNGLPANIVGDPLSKTMTFSRSISLSEGENTITVTATIGPYCSITKTTTTRLDTTPPPTGTISATTNLTGATFSLTGASSYSGNGTSWSTANAPAGTYTITYGAVTGYNTPLSETKTLSAGGSITFSGTYTLTEPPPKDNALYAEKRTVMVNESVLVPINIKNATNIGNMDILLTYDPNVVKATKVQKGSLTSDTMFDSNVQVASEIRISFASTQGIKGDGSIAYLEFQAIGSPGSTSPVTLVEAFANKTETFAKLNVVFSPGEVRISGSIILKGDVNGDSVVSAADALMALKMAVRQIPATAAADVNGDGRVTAADALLILQAATGKMKL